MLYRTSSFYVRLSHARMFSTYQTLCFHIDQPPKRELKVSDPDVKPKTLAQLDLAPSSVLSIKFQTDAYNGKYPLE